MPDKNTNYNRNNNNTKGNIVQCCRFYCNHHKRHGKLFKVTFKVHILLLLKQITTWQKNWGESGRNHPRKWEKDDRKCQGTARGPISQKSAFFLVLETNYIEHKSKSQQVYTEKHAELQSQTIQNKDAASVLLFPLQTYPHQNREDREPIMQ